MRGIVGREPFCLNEGVVGTGGKPVNSRLTIEGAQGPMAQGRRLSEQEQSARNPTLC